MSAHAAVEQRESERERVREIREREQRVRCFRKSLSQRVTIQIFDSVQRAVFDEKE